MKEKSYCRKDPLRSKQINAIKMVELTEEYLHVWQIAAGDVGIEYLRLREFQRALHEVRLLEDIPQREGREMNVVEVVSYGSNRKHP